MFFFLNLKDLKLSSPMISIITISLLSILSNNVKLNENPSVKNWSENGLKFEDFLAPPKSKSGIKGEFHTKISWTIAEREGSVPIYKIYNQMDRSKSWINKKHDELLKEYQFTWDMAELYTRKIRKEIENFNKKKVVDKEQYKTLITSYVSKYNKQRVRYEGTLYNQPDLYRIVNKQYQDSLKLYDKYALK